MLDRQESTLVLRGILTAKSLRQKVPSLTSGIQLDPGPNSPHWFVWHMNTFKPANSEDSKHTFLFTSSPWL